MCLLEMYARADELDKEIREKVKEISELIVGQWKITGRWVEKKEYTVPAMKYWQTMIRKL